LEPEKRPGQRTLFVLLTLLNLPLSLLIAMVLRVQLAGRIAETTRIQGSRPLLWFKPVEDFFGDTVSATMFAGIGVVLAIYFLAWALSFFSAYRTRPFGTLVLMHEAPAIVAVGALVAIIPPNFEDLFGILAVALIPFVLLAVPTVAWRLERAVGRVLVRWTMSLVQREQYDKSNSVLAAAIRFQPDDVQLRRRLGLSRFEAGDVIGAIKALEPLLPEIPNDPRLVEVLEECYRTERMWEQALDMARRLLALDPKAEEPRQRAARALDLLGRTPEAIALLREAFPTRNVDLLGLLLQFETKEQHPVPAIEVARMIGEAEGGSHARTLTAYRSLLETFPANIAVMEDLANLQILHRDEEQGHALLERVVAADPSRHDLRIRLVQYYQSRNHLRKAEPHLEALMDAGRDTVDVALLFGDILVQREDYDRALQHFQYAVENYPEDYRFAYFLAQIQLKTEALEDAFQWCRVALERAHGEEDVARVRTLQKRVDTAIMERELRVWQERCRRDPGNIELRLGLIEALARRGQGDRAVAECELLIESHPEQRAAVIRCIEALTQDSSAQVFRLLDYLGDMKIKAEQWDEAFAIAQRLAERSLDPGQLMVDHCRRILSRRPDHKPSLLALGRAMLQRQEWTEVLDAFECLLQIDSADNEEYLQAVLQAAVALGRSARGIEVIRVLLAKKPLDAALHIQAARLLTDLHEYDSAWEHVGKAESIDYFHPDVVHLKRDLEVKRREQRLAEVIKLLEAAPTDADLHLEAGELLELQGEPKKAIGHYQEAAHDARRRNVAGARLAAVMARLRMFDLVEETLDDVTLNIDDHAEADTVRGLVYDVAALFEAEGDNVRALKLYKKIFRVQAGFRDVVEKIDSLADFA
jgi:tetratricopeptide (TPR) repeat protein